MKRRIIIVLATLCLFPLFAKAQTKRINETFNADDKVRFEWEEYVDKKGGVEIKDDCLLLTNKEKGTSKMTSVNLPISVENSFEISVSMIVPNLNDKEYFGITIDNTEDYIKKAFFIKENLLKFRIIQNEIEGDEYDDNSESMQSYAFLTGANGKPIGENKKIKLNGGKNIPVNVVIEKKGKKLILSINNMKVFEKEYKSSDFMTSPTLGFIVNGNNSIKIDEITVEY
ncbi:MAG: hypothetical protein IJT45_03695 [Bacteroidales bacterium]|nr:hypothetical protein [Bacteroidales bacterium]